MRSKSGYQFVPVQMYSNRQILETLFPDMVHKWRVNAFGVFDSDGKLTGCAWPTGLHGCAITTYATRCYAGGVHCDPGDLGYTVGIRALRGEHEPKSAYQFVYTSLRRLGSPDDHHGVIMSQPTGTITLWPAKALYHGTSVDVREDGEIPEEGKSVNLTLVQKAALLTFCGNAGLDKVVDLVAVRRYYDLSCSSKTVTLGPQNKKNTKMSQKKSQKKKQKVSTI